MTYTVPSSQICMLFTFLICNNKSVHIQFRLHDVVECECLVQSTILFCSTHSSDSLSESCKAQISLYFSNWTATDKWMCYRAATTYHEDKDQQPHTSKHTNPNTPICRISTGAVWTMESISLNVSTFTVCLPEHLVNSLVLMSLQDVVLVSTDQRISSDPEVDCTVLLSSASLHIFKIHCSVYSLLDNHSRIRYPAPKISWPKRNCNFYLSHLQILGKINST